MKTLTVLSALMLIGCGNEQAGLSVLSDSGIVVQSSHDRADYPANSTLDGVYTTFMTTPELNIADTVTLTYQLPDLTDIESIDLVNDYIDEYALGDLTILVSSDSTDGADGTWETITQMNSTNHGFVNGDGNVLIERNMKWLKLKMEYYGSGAYGSSPSFYLSEIIFH